MQFRQRLLAGCILAAAICAGARAADETYVIKIERPGKVGDTADVHVVIDGSRTTTVVRPGAMPSVTTETVKGEVTGREKVTAVDARGDALGLTVTLDKMVDGTGHEMLAHGSVVKVQRGEKEVTFTLEDGTAVKADARGLLGRMYSTHSAEGPHDEDIFGTAERRKAGDSWPVQAAEAAKGLQRSGLTVAPQDISGKVSVKGVETGNGAPALRIEGEIIARNLKSDVQPNGAKVVGGESHYTFGGLLPVDVTRDYLEQNVHTQTDVILQAGTANVEIKSDDSVKKTATPVAAGR